MCRADELNVAEYCKKTGRKARIKCKDGNNEFDDYKSCDKAADDGQLEVIIFQVFMGVIGGLAYWGVQARKRNTMTLFDSRRIR